MPMPISKLRSILAILMVSAGVLGVVALVLVLILFGMELPDYIDQLSSYWELYAAIVGIILGYFFKDRVPSAPPAVTVSWTHAILCLIVILSFIVSTIVITWAPIATGATERIGDYARMLKVFAAISSTGVGIIIGYFFSS